MDTIDPGYTIVPAVKVNLKSKTGLRDALVAAHKGIPVVSDNIIQQEYLNRALNHGRYAIYS